MLQVTHPTPPTNFIEIHPQIWVILPSTYRQTHKGKDIPLMGVTVWLKHHEHCDNLIHRNWPVELSRIGRCDQGLKPLARWILLWSDSAKPAQQINSLQWQLGDLAHHMYLLRALMQSTINFVLSQEGAQGHIKLPFRSPGKLAFCKGQWDASYTDILKLKVPEESSRAAVNCVEQGVIHGHWSSVDQWRDPS